MLRATLRSLLARKLRLLLSAMAVVLGVSFVSGALVLTDTLGRTFDQLFEDINAKTDVEVRGVAPFEASSGSEPVRAPVPEELAAALREVPGVEAAVGDLQDYAQVVKADGEPYSTGGAPTLGVVYDDEPTTSPYVLRAGQAPVGPGELALDAATAEATGFGVGDTVSVLLSTGRRDLEVSGVFGLGESDGAGGASLVALAPDAAQELLGREGEYDAIIVAADRSVSRPELRDRIAAVLPPGVEAVTGDEAADEDAGDLQEALGFLTTFLLVFAGVALFVGAFLIFNTFTILVAQRQRELALLRALGASRGQVTRSVLVESLVVGVLASALGLGAGIGVAAGLRALASSFGGTLPDGPLIIATSTIVASFVVGVGVTAVAALLPARRASAVPPVAAMRDAAVPERSLHRLSLVGAVLLVLGLAVVAVGLTGELAVLGLGAVLVFLSVAALSPLLARPAARLLGAPLALTLPGRLGRLNAMRNPRRTATTAAALMIGLALVSAVSILGASAKTSIEKVVQGVVGADLVVQQVGGFAGFAPEVAEGLAALPEVGAADRLRFDQALIDGGTTFVTAVPGDAVGRSLLLTEVAGDVDELGPGRVLLDSETAQLLALTPGDTLAVTLARGGKRDFQVAGTYEPNELAGDYLLDLSAGEAFSTALDGVVLVTAADGVDKAELRAAVDAAAEGFPSVEVLDQDEFVEDAGAQIDNAITIINVLLALSVLIAVLGIVNTLALAVLERTRELGLLRAVGLGRRQTRRMVQVEAVVIALFGAGLGIVVGSALGVAAQRALADEGITELSFPVGRLAVFIVAAAVAGVLAAVLPARRAAKLDVLSALAST